MKEYVTLFPEDDLDVGELTQLINICDIELFNPKKKIVLNPTFGEGSKLVGGADADLIVDDTLIDIKVTKYLKLNRRIYNQLICYYLLYLIGGVDHHKDIEVKKLAVYFARHNYLWSIKVEDIGDEKHFKKSKEYLIKNIEKVTAN